MDVQVDQPGKQVLVRLECNQSSHRSEPACLGGGLRRLPTMHRLDGPVVTDHDERIAQHLQLSPDGRMKRRAQKGPVGSGCRQHARDSVTVPEA